MNKKEYIEKYGEEAYQRQLEYYKQYREQHKEKRMEYQKQYNQQHKEEAKQYYQQHKDEIKQRMKQRYQKHREKINQYNQQYYQQHKEEINEHHKQYIEQHKEEIKQYDKQYQKQWKRNHKNMFAYCIPEEIEQIENYWLAKESNFDGWHIHHRLETHNSDGQRRLVNLSIAELKALDMYYNRPANELVFLTASEHIKLHRTKQRCSKE